MRTRLRERHPDEAAFYRDRYPTGYHHTAWPDHVERVDETVRFATETLAGSGIRSVADLSCGDGDLASRLADSLDAPTLVLGDLQPPPFRVVDVIGRLPDTLVALPPDALPVPGPGVDLYVCSETLEHLDDPDAFLSDLRPLVKRLLLTTPVGEATDGNPEHYWGWDCEGVAAMLDAAGFTYIMGHQVFTPLYRTPDVIPTQMWMVA